MSARVNFAAVYPVSVVLGVSPLHLDNCLLLSLSTSSVLVSLTLVSLVLLLVLPLFLVLHTAHSAISKVDKHAGVGYVET